MILLFIMIVLIYYFEVDNSNNRKRFNAIDENILNNLLTIHKYSDLHC